MNQIASNLPFKTGSKKGESDASEQNIKDLHHAKEYIQYFKCKHTDKQLDIWVKQYLPLVLSQSHHGHKNIKKEI